MTPEGAAVARIIDRHGVWRRAGLAGVVSGINMDEALRTLPSNSEVEFATHLFVIAEAAFIAALPTPDNSET